MPFADVNGQHLYFEDSGEPDAAIPMEKAEQLQRKLGNCEELVRVPGAGHASSLSHPGGVNGPLLHFLRRHAK